MHVSRGQKLGVSSPGEFWAQAGTRLSPGLRLGSSLLEQVLRPRLRTTSHSEYALWQILDPKKAEKKLEAASGESDSGLASNTTTPLFQLAKAVLWPSS